MHDQNEGLLQSQRPGQVNPTMCFAKKINKEEKKIFCFVEIRIFCSNHLLLDAADKFPKQYLQVLFQNLHRQN